MAGPRLNYCTLIIGFLLCQGCARWNPSTAPSGLGLPTPNMSRNAVGLEIATVTLQPGQEGLLAEILSDVDEQVIMQNKRRILVENGIRAGIVGSHIPDALNLLFVEAADRRQHPTAETQRYLDEQRFVQCRPGKAFSMKLWGTREIPDAVRTRSQVPIAEATPGDFFVSVLGESQDESGAKVRLTPTLEFGPIRQRFAAQDNSFHLDSSRDSHSFDELTTDLLLRPGEIIVATCDPAMDKSLGKGFFRHGNRQKIVVIRLAQTQIDEFFEAE